jgi:hypothetical protein
LLPRYFAFSLHHFLSLLRKSLVESKVIEELSFVFTMKICNIAAVVAVWKVAFVQTSALAASSSNVTKPILTEQRGIFDPPHQSIKADDLSDDFLDDYPEGEVTFTSS